ncbi:MAG: uroporphyrinogen-III synthase [Thermoproteota archaeon]|nr:uroporphyrinogen-III synthase [Thermoproteota archaeon]
MSKVNIIITKEEIDKEDILCLPSQYLPDSTIGNIAEINIITLPTILTLPTYSNEVSNAIEKIQKGFYDYIIFLSARSVEIFFDVLKTRKINQEQSWQEIKKVNIIAIGPKTKKAVEKKNLKAFLTTTKQEYSSNSIKSFLYQKDKENKSARCPHHMKTKILIPRSSESLKSNNFITEIFDTLVLDQVFFYDTIEFDRVEQSKEWSKFIDLVPKNEAKCLIFTSPSTVRFFFSIICSKTNIPILSKTKNQQELIDFAGIKTVISLGPKTSEELKNRGIKYKESPINTINETIRYAYGVLLQNK